jgi:hypothetical protein
MNIVELVCVGVCVGGLTAGTLTTFNDVMSEVESKEFKSMSVCVGEVSTSHGLTADDTLTQWAEGTLPAAVWEDLTGCVSGFVGVDLLETEEEV